MTSISGIGGGPPPAVGSSLVLTPTAPIAPTSNHETDVVTALARGLAEYLSQQSIACDDGKLLRFVKVFHTWADPEDISEFPALLVRQEGEGTYESRQQGISDRYKIPSGEILVNQATYTTDLICEVWANDVAERAALMCLLEDALCPLDWLFGCRLDLPHYYGERASFEVAGGRYLDDEAESLRGVRNAHVRVHASVCVVRLASFPGAKPLLRLAVTTRVL